MFPRHSICPLFAVLTITGFGNVAGMVQDSSEIPGRFSSHKSGPPERTAPIWHRFPVPATGRGSTAQMLVTLTPSAPPPAPAGTVITWSANIPGPGSGDNLWYRFRVRPFGGDFHIVRDYGPESTLDWATTGEESYEIEVSVNNRETNETAAASVPYQISSRVSDGTAVVNATSNPLLFLYSAPPPVRSGIACV